MKWFATTRKNLRFHIADKSHISLAFGTQKKIIGDESTKFYRMCVAFDKTDSIKLTNLSFQRYQILTGESDVSILQFLYKLKDHFVIVLHSYSIKVMFKTTTHEK